LSCRLFSDSQVRCAIRLRDFSLVPMLRPTFRGMEQICSNRQCRGAPGICSESAGQRHADNIEGPSTEAFHQLAGRKKPAFIRAVFRRRYSIGASSAQCIINWRHDLDFGRKSSHSVSDDRSIRHSRWYCRPSVAMTCRAQLFKECTTVRTMPPADSAFEGERARRHIHPPSSSPTRPCSPGECARSHRRWQKSRRNIGGRRPDRDERRIHRGTNEL